MTKQDNGEQILDLTDLAPERIPVKVTADSVFEMISPKEMSFKQRAKVVALTTKIENLNSKANPSGDQLTQLEKAMRDLTRLALPDAPDEAIDELTPYQLDLVTGRFLMAFGGMISQAAKAIGSEGMAELISAS